MSKNLMLNRAKLRLAQNPSIRKQVVAQGDPTSMFYGDPIEVNEEAAAEAIGHSAPAEEVVPAAIVEAAPNEVAAAQKIAAYEAMGPTEKAMVTQLPALACWNAFTTVNPLIGRILATSLNYMLLKSLNDYPFEGATFMGENDGNGRSTVTIDGSSSGLGNRVIAVPFFRFAIAASTLTARPGAQVTINVRATDPQGNEIDTSQSNYTYSFQRLNSTEAIIGVYIVNTVVATRTLPFLALAGQNSGGTPYQLIITFEGIQDDEQVTVTIPGYATPELREISRMYALPAGDVR